MGNLIGNFEKFPNSDSLKLCTSSATLVYATISTVGFRMVEYGMDSLLTILHMIATI